MDTGCISLVMLARIHQIAAEPQALQHQFGQSGKSFPTVTFFAQHPI